MNIGPVRSLWIYLLLALLAVNACCAAVAFFNGSSTVAGVLSVAIASVLFSFLLFAWRGGMSRLGLVIRIAAIPVSIIALMLLFRLEMGALSLLLHHFPPPRPMFGDQFRRDERHMLPYWHPSIPHRDRFGNLAWEDKGNNLLLVVTGKPRGARRNALLPGLCWCRVKAGSGRFVTLPRTKDAFVIVLPDGSLHIFSIRGVGPIKCFLFHIHMDGFGRGEGPNLLKDAGHMLLDPPERTKFDRVLTGYQEPDHQED